MARNAEKDLQQREQRMNDILDAAIEVMAVKGVGSASMQHIAGAAGISIGNLYHYFKSKEEIFAEVLRRGQTGYGEFVRSVADGPGEARAKLLTIAENWLALGNSWAHTILIHTARLSEASEELRRDVTGRFTVNLQPVAAIIAQGQAEGTAPEGDPLELAFYFTSLIQGLTLQRMPGSEVLVPMRAASVVDLFAGRREALDRRRDA